MLRTALALVLAGSLATVVYAAFRVSGAEGYPSLIGYAVGIFGALFLLLAGLVDSKTADRGILAAVSSTLPKLLKWAFQRNLRASLVATAAITLAGAAIWLGPLGIYPVSLACDEADRVTIDGDYEAECSVALKIDLWRGPVQRISLPEPPLICSADRNGIRDEWERALSSNRCGIRPLEVQYIRNGVPLPSGVAATNETSVEGARIQLGHQELQKLLNSIPERNRTDNLLFATWNLRSFGGGFGFRPRSDEAMLYIAEAMSHFDLIAIQEIYDEAELTRLMTLLGLDYAYSLGLPGAGFCGNSEGRGERLGFIYDKRKLQLLSDNSSIVVNVRRDVQMLGEYPEWTEAIKDFATQPCRSPYFARFATADVEFSVFTLHTYFGSSSGEKYIRRLADTYRAMNYFKRYASNLPNGETMLFGGDLNAARVDGPVQEVVEKLGFDLLGPEYQVPTNMSGIHAYDRIGGLFPPEGNRLEAARHGVVDHFSVVYLPDQFESYRPQFAAELRERTASGRPVTNERKHYDRWRSHQISDHRLRWVEFVVLPAKATDRDP